MADLPTKMINYRKLICDLKEIIGGHTGHFVPRSADPQLTDFLEKVFHAGVAAAVDNDIREKVREQLANDPHCYD